MNSPKIIIIAGPNGAGKTTFAREFLPYEAACPNYINADLIAEGLAPFAPETASIKAGRLMLEQIAEHAAKKRSFAFETTLSGLTYARQIPLWRTMGYRVELFFLALNTPETAINRVAERVKQGGHNIPQEVVERRFVTGLRNFEQIYCRIVNAWVRYDNSGEQPKLIDWGENP